MCRRAENSGSISDVHIVQNDKPWIRVDGHLQRFNEYYEIEDAEIKAFYERNLGQYLNGLFAKTGYASTSLHQPEFGDIRLHVLRKTEGIDMVIRMLNAKVPDIDSLGLPRVIKSFADTPNGLYLFTGATGMGKSTALAALVHEINQKYNYSIFTVEDPIEYRHDSIKSLVRQLTIGKDVDNYADAIRSFLRSDPDVILIGEMRDTETMEAALQAAETGHLVFSTVHDNGAAETCQRIIGSFKGDRQAQITMSFASVVRGVVSLRLVPMATGEGRIAAAEVMISNDAVRNQIIKGEFQQIRTTIQQGRESGMQVLEDELNRLVRDGLITYETAVEYSNQPKEIKRV